MPIFVKDNKYFLFMHVPKTGGTSLEVVFARSGFTSACIDYGAEGTLNHLRHCSPQHMHAEALQSQFSFDRFDGVFMVTRNPYDRFRSEYCMAHGINIDTSASVVELWATRVFSDYALDNYTLDNHLRPQHEFYIPGAITCKFEQGFTNIIQDISTRYAISLITENIRELARARNSGTSSSDVELNPAVIKMINKQYKKDFEQFEYEVKT